MVQCKACAKKLVVQQRPGVYSPVSDAMLLAALTKHAEVCPIRLLLKEGPGMPVNRDIVCMKMCPKLEGVMNRVPQQKQLKMFLDSLNTDLDHKFATLVEKNGDGHFMLPLEKLREFFDAGGTTSFKTVVPKTKPMREVEAWLKELVAVDADLKEASVLEETLMVGRLYMGLEKKARFVTGLALLWADSKGKTIPPQFKHVDVKKDAVQALAPLYPHAKATLVHTGKLYQLLFLLAQLPLTQAVCVPLGINLKPSDVLKRYGMDKIRKTRQTPSWWTNNLGQYANLAKTKAELDECVTPAVRNNVLPQHHFLLLRGGIVHAGPGTDRGEFRPMLFAVLGGDNIYNYKYDQVFSLFLLLCFLTLL